MAENPQLSQGNDGQMVPTPFPNERILCTRKGMQIEVKGLHGRKWSAKGFLFLTDMRMVFVVRNPAAGDIQAFDLPLVYIRGDRFNQPIFGCNNLSGDVWPVCENGGPDGTLPPHPYKLFFLEGGVGTFLPLYFHFITAAREADRNRRGRNGAAVAAAQQQAPVQEHMQQAFVDPNDPTSLFLTQPVAQTTQQAPKYASNYGQDEAYAPMI